MVLASFSFSLSCTFLSDFGIDVTISSGDVDVDNWLVLMSMRCHAFSVTFGFFAGFEVEEDDGGIVRCAKARFRIPMSILSTLRPLSLYWSFSFLCFFPASCLASSPCIRSRTVALVPANLIPVAWAMLLRCADLRVGRDSCQSWGW